MNAIEIWQPRYKDNVVLVAKYKVKAGLNYIKFTKAKHLAGMIFAINSTEVCRCPIENIEGKNGSYHSMYAIPFDWLHRIEDE